MLLPEYPLELKPRWGWDGATMLEPLAARLEASFADYEDTITAASELVDWARNIPRTTTDAGVPCWENDWWGTLDALVQCAALKQRDPALYLEIGSGMSTLFARRAIADFSLRTRIVSVDPQPRGDVDACCDEVIRQPFDEVADSLAERLAADDVVFLDGSHVALMGSDATVFMLDVLPRLPAGVLVGIDDVFLPWDYPPTWSRRVYGEQYLLAAFLLGGGEDFRIRFPGWWLTRCSPPAGRFDALWPVVENRFGRLATSFWIERVP